jgi:hypothetical protein
MINKGIFLIGVFLYLSGATVNAQVSIAPKIGLSYTKLSGDLNNTRYIPSALVGGMLNVDFKGILSMQSGLLVSGKGTTLYYDEADQDAMVISYLEVPLNFILAAGSGPGRVQFFAGPYVAYAANATYKYLADEDNLKEKIMIGTSPQDEIKPFDIGVNAGIGFWFEGLEVQAGYGSSVTNISNLKNEKLANNIIFLSLAYYIRLDSKPYYAPRRRR